MKKNTNEKTEEDPLHAKRLQELRLQMNIATQTEMAKQLGIPQGTYSHTEKGLNKPSWNLIVKLSKRFPNLNLRFFVEEGASMWLSNSDSKNSYDEPSFREVLKVVHNIQQHILEEKRRAVFDLEEKIERLQKELQQLKRSLDFEAGQSAGNSSSS